MLTGGELHDRSPGSRGLSQSDTIAMATRDPRHPREDSQLVSFTPRHAESIVWHYYPHHPGIRLVQMSFLRI